MARTALTIVGGIVGAYFGYPQLGLVAGSLIGNAVDPQQIQGPKIGETGAQTSAEGAPRAIVYGTASVTGNVIATGPLVITEVSTGGGKGGPETTSDEGRRTYAIRICEGPITGVLRIWEDEKLVYDVRPVSTIVAESVKWVAGCTIYLGDESQMPDPVLNAQVPPYEHPAHRGSAYMVFGSRNLTDRRGSIPQYRFEVCTSGWVTEELNGPANGVESIPWFSSGFIANGQTKLANPGDTVTPDVCLFSFEAVKSNLAPGSSWNGFAVTATITIDGALVYTHAFTADATVSVQVNAMGRDVFAQLTVYNGTGGGLGNTVCRIHATSVQPVPGIGLGYAPYYGGGAYPNVIREEAGDIYYGVLRAADGELWSAEWGPEVLIIIGDGEPVSLGFIVSDIQDRCALPSNEFDVSELTDLVAGLVLAGDYTAADAIDKLRSCYFFDKTEYDKKIWYPKRGKPVVETITFDNLVDVPDTSKREQAVEFPRKWHLRYQHAASGYAPVKATSARSSPDVRVVGEVTVEMPVVLNEDQAAQMSAKQHKVAWAEAEGEVTLSVPLDYIDIVPSDVIGLYLRGQVKRLRLEKAEYSEGKINWTLRRDRQSAYTSDVTGVPIPDPTPPPPTIVGQTVLVVADISARQDSEDDLNYLVAVTGPNAAWYGAMVQRSLDGGASYSDVVSINRAARIGELLDYVADADEHTTDTTNTVRVQLYRESQEIESISDAQFLSEGGSFILENADGSFEIMQYRDASQDSNGAFVLSMLHRGRLNSGTSEHLVGAKFVMLEDMTHVPASSAWIGQTLTHRAVSFGQSPELADEQDMTYVGRSQIEWPVASLSAYRDGSDNISASWSPRHRFGTDDNPIASINFQGYRVTLDDGSSQVVFDTATPSFTYDASSLADPLTVSISSINRITGAGPAESVSV